MPQPVSYNTGTPVSGSIQENSISYVVDGQGRDYRGGYNGLAWMSEAPTTNNVIFIGNTNNVGRGPANTPLFYPSLDNSSANIIYAANHLPGSPGNFSDTASAFQYAIDSGFFINNSNSPISRIDADGLTLYTNANQPGSYPGVNNIGYDISGNGFNGDLRNGTAWNNNGWFTFDGVDDFIDFGNTSGGIGGSSEATMELLINMTFPSALQQIFGFRDNSGFDFFFLAFSGGGSEFRARNSTGYVYDLNPSLSSYAGKWTQINFSVGPSGRKVYANGNLIDSNAAWAGNFGGTSPLSLGNYQAGNTWFATGAANNVKLYNKELSQAEIQQNYYGGPIITDNISGSYNADNLVSYITGSTNTYNMSANIISGSLQNGVGYSPLNGGYWSFDGVDDKILLEGSTTSAWVMGNGTLPWTVNAWIKTTSLAYGLGVGGIFSNSSGGPIVSQIGIANGYINYWYYLSSWNQANGSTFISDGQWHLLTWVNNSNNTLDFYVDSKYDGTIANSLVANANYLNVIGNSYTGTAFSGNIASLQINKGKAFTASEVQQQYQATKYKFGL